MMQKILGISEMPIIEVSNHIFEQVDCGEYMKSVTQASFRKKTHIVDGLKKYKLFIAVGFLMVVIALIALSMQGENLKLRVDKVTALNSGWTLTTVGQGTETIELPYITEASRNEVLSIQRNLPEVFNAPLSIRIRSSMQHIIVTLDEAVIFDNRSLSQQGLFKEPLVSAWHIINIAEASGGGQLTIQVSSDVQMMSGRINEIYFGQTSDLVAELITRQPISIFFALFLLMIGCLTGIIGLTIRLDRVKRLTYLSLFTSSISIWLINELDIMQLITGNKFIVGAISYIMLPLALIGFLLLLKVVVLDRYNKSIMGLVWITGIYLVVSIILQLLLGIHFINEFKFFNPLVLGSSLYVVGLLLFESIRYQNVVAKKYLYIIAILLVTVMVEVAKFFTGDFMSISDFGSIGIAVFMVVLMMDTLKYIKEVIEKEGQLRYLEEIAYRDALTGGPNRSAFEKDVDELLMAKDKVQFRLIMFDLNNLKLINDQYGHNWGDVALKDFCDCLKKAYDATSKCYRVGGDEFMVIQKNSCENEFIKAQAKLEEEMNDIESKRDYKFRCAYGSGVYQFDQSFGEFKHTVDLKMYQMKKEQKSHQ